MAKRTLTTWTKLTRCCLLSATCEQEFNPEKYKHLADIFGHAYLGSGSPVSIVSLFLSAFTKGQISNPPEACEPFVAKNYDIRKAYVACSFKGQFALLFLCNLHLLPPSLLLPPLLLMSHIIQKQKWEKGKAVIPVCAVVHLSVHTEVVEQFGIESILIFNALLLKKKVVVYAPSLETVLRVCR